MKIPKFKTEAEEADWWYANRNKVKWGKPMKRADGSPMSVEEVIADYRKRTAAKAISIRLPEADIAAMKKRAERKGIGYQTLLRMVVHEYLER
jgi:hypothetical protein